MFKSILTMSLCALLSIGVMQAQSSDCGRLQLPYVEGFDAVAEYSQPNCWTTLGTEGYPRVSAIRGSNGTSQSLYYSIYNPSWGVMPEFAINSMRTATLTFDFYTQNMGVIRVGVMTDPTDTTTFTLVQTINANQLSWVSVTVPFESYTGSGKHIAITTNCSVYIDNIAVSTTEETPGTPDTPGTTTIPDLPLITGFEDAADNALWQTTTTTTGVNLFAIGSAVNHGGNNALYISNDGGVSAAYTNTNATVTFIHRPFHLQNDNTVMISYDWACHGESGYDKGRVFVAPANADISALTSTELSNLMSNYTTNPTGWLNADGGSNLSGVDNWTTKSVELNLTAGDYLLVIGWKDDSSGGNNPTFMLDNLSVREKVCYLQEMTAAAGATDVTVNASTDCPTVQVQIADSANVVLFDTVATLPYTYSNLNPSTAYTVKMRGFCLSGDTTDWATASIITLCADLFVDAQNHYTDNFEGYVAGTDNYLGCWLKTIDNTSGTLPYVTTSSYTGGGQSVAFSGSSTRNGYLATPNITGTPINQLRVKFKASLLYASYMMEVGVMTDPLDYTTFTPVKRITPTLTGWTDYIVDLGNYTGTGRSIAFRAVGNNFNIDDVEILPTPSCLEPTFNLTTSVGSVSIEITPAFPTDRNWDVVVKTTANINDTVAPLLSQTINDSNFVVNGLDNLTTYYVFVRTHCSATEQSEWIMKNITTPCGYYTVPYTHDFATFPGNCWYRYTGRYEDVAAGTTPLASSSNGWYQCTNGKGISATHAKVNLWDNNQRYWIATPEFMIAGPAELSFDLALTTYNSNNACTPGNQPTHRFGVVASVDGGATWSNIPVAMWDNVGSSRVYDSIPATATHVTLSLNDFVGGSVKVAFYAESSGGSADLDLHIGNISIDLVGSQEPDTVMLTDQICQGNGYNANGFSFISLPVAGEYVFNRTSNDTVYNLTLTVLPTAAATEEITICDTQLPYAWNGQSLTAAGEYTFTTTAANGCDSVVTLTLTVNNAVAATEEISICDTDLPYAWNGQSLTAAGEYTFNTTAANGCDSVVTLTLTVNASFAQTDSLSILDTELPYQWNGQEITVAGEYTFNGTTAEGCDSIITLVLDVQVGLDYAEDGMFAITPNPVERGGNVRIDANVEEKAVVELYTANGKLISRSEHQAKPIYVTMPQEAGLYMVRLTTASGRVLYGKVIVK